MNNEAPKTVRLADVSLPKYQTILLSCGSGCFAWCFTHPFEMWKNNVMTAPPGTSQWDMFKETRRKGLYRGFATGVARQVVYGGARLGLYPSVRSAVLDAEVRLGIKQTNDVSKATLLDRAVAAALAGAFASFLSSPVDVCLILQTTSKEKVPLWHTIQGVLRQSGMGGFWRGYTALGTRAAVGGASQVGVHDHVLTHLREYNHQRASPFHDNVVINVASAITGLFCAVVTMPLEFARVQMSLESKLPRDVPRRYTSMTTTIVTVAKEEGVRRIYDSFFPYFIKYAAHTIFCFFALEYGNRELRARKARREGLTLLV